MTYSVIDKSVERLLSKKLNEKSELSFAKFDKLGQFRYLIVVQSSGQTHELIVK